MKKKSLLILGNYPPPFGGVPIHLSRLVPYLVERGWDVHVLAQDSRGSRRDNFSGYTLHRPPRWERVAHSLVDRRAWSEGLIHMDVLRMAPKLCLGALSTFSVAAQIIKEFDVRVISAYHIFSAGLVGSWVSKRFGIPLVTTVFGEIFAFPSLYRHLRTVAVKILQSSHRIISCSQHCADSLRNLNVDLPVEVVYYGVDPARFHPGVDGAPMRARWGLSPERQVVLYLARMVHEMGLHVLLKAIPEVLRSQPSSFFVIAGASGSLSAEAVRVANRYPQNVVVLPDIPTEDLPGLYAAADVLAAPSINQRACFGLSIAEASAVGRPAVGCQIGGTPEVLQHGKNGLLVPPADPQALAQALLTLLENPSLCQEMGREGRKCVTEKFDVLNTHRSMERIFLETLPV
ncbi:MAG: glycosyltransferase family 4 protein [Elusimicrobia bacterium]|nr:glycosyltransferase family 4 protein [Elusimicrobiota bacterium]